MVPFALPTRIVAPLAFLSVTVNVSSLSTYSSSSTRTGIVPVRLPAEMVNVPLVPV